jgi:predicted TIM-barrel fold metal-dependent hydrolase
MGKLLLGDNYANRYNTGSYVRALKETGVYKAVNLDGFWGDDLNAIKEKIGDYSDFFLNFMWIDFHDIGDAHFKENTRRRIHDAYDLGIRGIKMWKDITLFKKDQDNKPIRTDDERLDAIYDTAAELNIPVLMHIGDPVAFFKKRDAHNERWEEMQNYPDFSDRSRFYSFEDLISMQENTIRNHPGTTFIIAHVGSYSENLGWVQRQLDLYPNMYVDIAARISELGRVPFTAHRFFIHNQDRILFGTDTTPISLGSHLIYYRFLETHDEYFPYQISGEKPGQGRWAIYGLHLPDDVLKKIYYKNACHIFGQDLCPSEETE